MIAIGLWPLLLPVAAFSGWLIGRRRKVDEDNIVTLSREYYVGLNYLLNEQPDKAVDIFIKLLEVDGDTVETHLALGSLFRRRGEVDRAIRIHQNLIARPQLSKAQRTEALLELGRDYMKAGVLDRAERIFREIVDLGSGQTVVGLQYLLDIYQQEKAWDSAVKTAKKLGSIKGENMHRVIAHHYCEMAEMALAENNVDVGKQLLKKAFAANRNSVRASLLQARLESSQGHHKAAIKLYKQIKTQDPDFLSEMIVPMAASYEQLGIVNEFIKFLKETLAEYPRISIVLVLADLLFREEGANVAIDFVTEQLRRNPSVRGLSQLIKWHLDTTDGKVKEKLQMLQDITRKLLETKPVYRCEHCGFSGKKLHWQCPGCKQWDTMKPVRGLEGD